MSLTSLLTTKTEKGQAVRNLFKGLFTLPKLSTKNFQIVSDSISTNFTIIGSAYDYLLRFTIEKHYSEKTYSNGWIAERQLRHFRHDNVFDGPIPDLNMDEIKKFFEKQKKENHIVINKFDVLKKEVNKYIYTSAAICDKVIEASLFFSRLDLFHRLGQTARKYILDTPTKNDILDLKKLIHNTDINLFKPNKKAILNPTFGIGSRLVGGADADLITDNILIDIKVTNEMVLKRKYFNQLIGYYILYLIGGIDNFKNITIDSIGIYFARYNYLWSIKINEIGVPDKWEKATKHFKKILDKKNTANNMYKKLPG